MMAAFILAFSLATLLMFFVSYCRSLMASSSRHVLSEEVRDVIGVRSGNSVRDFTRVMQLLQLCPERPQDRSSLHAVGFYYSILNLAQETVARIVPSLQSWTEQERAGCAYFAAVTLDRRIAFSREMLAQQAEL
jgi:hypothetical protein